MPPNIAKFEDDTAFERYVLARGFPLVPQRHASNVVDLGDILSVAAQSAPPHAVVTGSDSSSSAEDQLRSEDIRPLTFGAAWKVLDLLVESRLVAAGEHGQGQNKEYSIACKTQKARDGDVSAPPPFDDRGELWTRIMQCYAATETLRHSLVHRRLTLDPLTGNMIGTTRSGEPDQLSFTVDEHSAFCCVAEGVAEAVISGELSERRANQLRWLLDQLVAHHSQLLFGVPRSDGLIPLVIVRPSVGAANEFELDFALIRDRAHAAVEGVTYYDLEVHLPNGRVLAAPLEDTPNERVPLSAESLPDWIRLV
ncbi:hypothetical protein ACFW9U_23180 [Rhodococcus aetherivorans]|uniref:hypothetical protein n=1 Tax=Rhodococcus aetherivorans TaxID=191292 RepID=UPI00367284C3